jgi:ankyrin repeat protein
MRKVLQTLPKDLNETYDRIIQNIPQTRIHNAIKLLQLLIHAKTPMLLGEVVDAVATNPDDEWPFIFENRVDPVDAIMGYCPSFLRITTTYAEKGYLSDSGEDEENEEDEKLAESNTEVRLTIQIAHFSVQEYLLLDREENPYRRSFEEQSANATITQLCLAYLWTVAEAEEAVEVEHSIPEFPFAEYAAQSWLYHASIAGDSQGSTFNWICKSFTHDRFAGCWWRLNYGHECQSSILALYRASAYGLHRSVEHLLEAGADPNDYTESYRTALQCACGSGSIEIVRLLIDHGADLNPADGGRNALHVAAYNGHGEILLLLVDSGAQVNATDVWFATSLQEACERGYVEVVQVLLERGADVNLMDLSGTALHYTIFGLRRSSLQVYDLHFAKIVRMLLDHGADVNTSRNARGCALLSACEGKHIDRGVVQLLLDHGADPNVAGGEYGNALCTACRLGDLAVVEMLLQAGADVNAVGGPFYCALCIAAIFGQVEVLRVLLEKGAISNTRGWPYRYALEDALLRGKVDTAEVLFERQASSQLAINNADHSPRLKVRSI